MLTRMLFRFYIHSSHNAKKIKSLLKSNEGLRREIVKLKEEGKDNHRVRVIKEMRVQVREQEAVIEALKSSMKEGGASEDDILAIIEDCTTQPKLARAPRVESLQRQVVTLTKEKTQLAQKLVKLQHKVARLGSVGEIGEGSGSLTSRSLSSEHIDSLSREDLLEHVELLEAEVHARGCSIHSLKDIVQGLQSKLRSSRSSKSRLSDAESKRKLVAKQYKDLKAQVFELVQQNEVVSQSVHRAGR